jgi:hypothetical protein
MCRPYASGFVAFRGPRGDALPRAAAVGCRPYRIRARGVLVVMRVVVGAGLGVVTAVAVWLALGLFVVYAGGIECGDRGSCNWLGDTAATHGWVVAGFTAFVAMAAGTWVARAWIRRR